MTIRWKILRHFSEFDQNLKFTIKIFHTLSDLLIFSNGYFSVLILYSRSALVSSLSLNLKSQKYALGCFTHSQTVVSFPHFSIPNFSVLFSCFAFLCLRQFSATEHTGEKLKAIELYLSFMSKCTIPGFIRHSDIYPQIGNNSGRIVPNSFSFFQNKDILSAKQWS